MDSSRFPIENAWYLKISLALFLGVLLILGPLVAFLIYGSTVIEKGPTTALPLIGVSLVLLNTYLLLSAKFFSFELKDDFLLSRQGVISKSEKHMPYGVTQNIFIYRTLIDRLLNLSNLVIENAAGNGGKFNSNQQGGTTGVGLIVGFQGNRLIISGLSAENAEELKRLLLEKMVNSRAIVTGSGL